MTVAADWADDELRPELRAPEDLRGDADQAGKREGIRVEEPSRAEYFEHLRELEAREFGGSGYWREVPKLEREAAELRDRYPADTPTAPADAGQRGVDAGDAVERIRRSEAQITTDVGDVAEDDSHGMWLEGLDCRLKGEQRLREKIDDTVRGNPGASPEQVASDIPDAIRYTFCADAAGYTGGFWDVTQRLEERGYHMYQCKNLWENHEYKGVNSRWITPDGQRFEVQFHTTESFHAKQHLTHWSYEQIRTTGEHITPAQRSELKAFQQRVASFIHTPERAAEIPDFREEGF